MDKNYDEGLVHGHNWSAEPPTPASAAKLQGDDIAASMSAHPEEEFFDDGLVHGHDWARS